MKSLLLPNDEREDPEFREELIELSVRGLKVIGWICILVSLLFLVVARFWLAGLAIATRASMAIIVLGIVTLLVAHWSRSRRFARVLAILNGYMVAFLLTWDFLTLPDPAATVHYTSAHLIFVLLVGIAVLPVTPLQVAALGLGEALTYLAFVAFLDLHATVGDSVFVPFAVTLQVALTCPFLAGIVYRQRASAFRARRSAERAFEELRDAQARLLISENTASQGRFAATLSHELNTPLGALKSAVDTLNRAFEKIAKNPAELERLDKIVKDATGSARRSSERIESALERMRQLANLDRAEAQVVDLNDLTNATLGFLKKEPGFRARVELDLGPLTAVYGRPQQLSAVLSNLLRNAAAAVENGGVIRISGREGSGHVVLEIADNGTGMSREQLERLFEPTFRVESGRVATTNWGLFVSRRIVADHGGHIEIDSVEGEGTTARLQLPTSSMEP